MCTHITKHNPLQLYRTFSRSTSLVLGPTAGETGTTTGSRTVTPESSGRLESTTPTTRPRSSSGWLKLAKSPCSPGNKQRVYLRVSVLQRWWWRWSALCEWLSLSPTQFGFQSKRQTQISSDIAANDVPFTSGRSYKVLCHSGLSFESTDKEDSRKRKKLHLGVLQRLKTVGEEYSTVLARAMTDGTLQRANEEFCWSFSALYCSLDKRIRFTPLSQNFDLPLAHHRHHITALYVSLRIKLLVLAAKVPCCPIGSIYV